MTDPQQSLTAVTTTTDGEGYDFGGIARWHEGYVVLTGYSGGTINAYIQLSADGVNWWTPQQQVNAALTQNGTFHIGATSSTPVEALARYSRALVQFGSGAVGTISAWTLGVVP